MYYEEKQVNGQWYCRTTPVFDAMNLPETPAFPSVRGKA